MKDFIYSEKFDKYLKGKLQKNEKLSFEEELRQDPLLRNEVKWQKEIFDSLGDARRSYLKSRLDQVPINSSSWYNFTAIQWATVVTSFFIFTAGSYYFYQDRFGKSEIQVPKLSVDIKVPEDNRQISMEEVQATPPFVPFEDKTPEAETLTASSEVLINKEDTANNSIGTSTIAKKPELQDSNIPQIVRPDILSTFNEDSQQIDYSDFELPDKNLLQESVSSVSEIEIETLLESKYHFHYQLYNHKLYLHGDFQGIPYKIIALNQNDSKKLFLQFNGDFYKLRQEQEEITPLEVINDSTIINALTKLSR